MTDATWWHMVTESFLANPELLDKWTLNQGRQSVRTTNCTSPVCQEAKGYEGVRKCAELEKAFLFINCHKEGQAKGKSKPMPVLKDASQLEEAYYKPSRTMKWRCQNRNKIAVVPICGGPDTQCRSTGLLLERETWWTECYYDVTV
ncbi:hypothetical protein JB92DRAFT_2832977 [Gautieria morchelliformis]|nr:hypothetical protein JB92DRAFT_2832977 [Gautieria morchelliformis]